MTTYDLDAIIAGLIREDPSVIQQAMAYVDEHRNDKPTLDAFQQRIDDAVAAHNRGYLAYQEQARRDVAVIIGPALTTHRKREQ